MQTQWKMQMQRNASDKSKTKIQQYIFKHYCPMHQKTLNVPKYIAKTHKQNDDIQDISITFMELY